jgi:hypothetical protein
VLDESCEMTPAIWAALRRLPAPRIPCIQTERHGGLLDELIRQTEGSAN